MDKLEKVIKDNIVEYIFFDWNSDLKPHPYDFFMRSDIDDRDTVERSPLGEYWGFDTADEYILEDIRAIRGVMQSTYDRLEDFAKKVMDIKKTTMRTEIVGYIGLSYAELEELKEVCPKKLTDFNIRDEEVRVASLDDYTIEVLGDYLTSAEQEKEVRGFDVIVFFGE